MTAVLIGIIVGLVILLAVFAHGGARALHRCDDLTATLRAERLKRQEDYEALADLFDENLALKARLDEAS